MSDYQIVHLAPEDWRLYKALRLEMLQTDPHAYGSSYEETLARPDAFWQGRLAEAQAGKSLWMVFSREDGRLTGMIGAHVEEPGVVELVSVYVAKDRRGKGISSALMTAILDEVRRTGLFHKVVLDVNANQPAAVGLYRRFSFEVVCEHVGTAGDGNSYLSYTMEKQLP